MKKILIRIQNHSLFFFYKKNKLAREDLMNTNIISDSELIFSDDYLKENTHLVIPFFNELCKNNQVDTLTFQNNKIALDLLKYFKGNNYVKNVKIKKEENITYALCEELLELKTIKNLECYTLPNFMLELLDKHSVKVTTHSEVFYISAFMQKNELTDYSKLFYKKQIEIYEPLTDEDKEDFVSFLHINKYLKVIRFRALYSEDLEFILEQLKKYRFKYVYIELCYDVTDSKDILYLKELNKKYKQDKLQIELSYSSEYLNNNLIKQISLNTLKVCGLILISLVVGSFGYVFIRNYKSMQEVSLIQEKVNKVIEDSEQDEEILTPPETNNGEELVIKNKYIASLLSINPDVVGYLKVKNTRVDYPVVISKDNVYYLGKNLYQEDDINGWIYMDFRNSPSVLNDNTIIYGHNMYYSGVMFGSLHNVLNADWQADPNNMIISFDTMYESMNWQIFSIYTIPKTSDYLKVNFETNEDKLNYINMVKGRSVKDFGIEVGLDDKMLTLSTCTGDNSRLVIHAKKL